MRSERGRGTFHLIGQKGGKESMGGVEVRRENRKH